MAYSRMAFVSRDPRAAALRAAAGAAGRLRRPSFLFRYSMGAVPGEGPVPCCGGVRRQEVGCADKEWCQLALLRRPARRH